MAITPRSGFSPSTSGPNDIENDIPNTQADVLNNMPYITDTTLNKVAINESAYPNVTRQLVGFMKGKRTLVTYYRSMRRTDVNFRNNTADYPTARNVLDSEYQKIINFEITLPRAFEFTSDSSSSSIDVSGEAMFYPHMNPSVGDVFLMAMGDGRVGIFQVSKVDLGSWRSDSIYIIKFILQSFSNPTDLEALEGSVTSTYVFSKANHLGATAALLSEQTYLDLQRIRSIRRNLIGHYFRSFFDDELCSYLRPDGYYDPHAVKFMADKATMDDLKVRPKLLTGSLPKIYNSTIWARLDDRHNNSIIGLLPRVEASLHQKSRLGVFNTELIGRYVLEPTTSESTEDFYIFTENFYSGSVADMTPFELRVYKALTERTCGDLTSLLVEYLTLVYSLEPLDQYYKIPLYIHLIDMALQSQYREIDAPSMNYASTGE